MDILMERITVFTARNNKTIKSASHYCTVHCLLQNRVPQATTIGSYRVEDQQNDGGHPPSNQENYQKTYH